MNRFKISTLVFFLTLLISGRVFSQTNYDFSVGYFSISDGSFGGSMTFTGTSTNSNQIIDQMSNLVFEGRSISNSNITSGAQGFGSYPTNPYVAQGTSSGDSLQNVNFSFVNPFSPSSTVYFYTCNNGVGVNCNYPSYSFYTQTLFVGAGSFQINGVTIDQGNSSPYGYATGNTSFNISSGYAGAPEIDGSLAPKVGFLLGCLFLMFGRKKQNLIEVHL